MKYLAKRLIKAALLLFAISVFVFIIVSLIPGNSIEGNLSPGISTEKIEQQKAYLGLDKPIVFRYVAWLKNILSGNFGYSFSYKMQVSDVMKTHIYPTFLIGIFAILLQIIIGFPLGIYGACNKKWGKIVNGLSLISLAVPMFFIGLILKYIFSLKLMILPLGGLHTVGVKPNAFDTILHLALPAIVLSFGNLGAFLRYIKYFANDVLNKDYITLAVAKGLPKSRIIFGHVLKNMIVPLITIVGLNIPTMFAGAYIVEVLFSINGMGKLAINSFFARDYNLIMAYTMILSSMIILANIIVDVLYKVFDKRIKL